MVKYYCMYCNFRTIREYRLKLHIENEHNLDLLKTDLNKNESEKRIQFMDLSYDLIIKRFIKILNKSDKKFKIVENNPNIIFFSTQGNNHKKDIYKNTKKIFFTGENVKPKIYANLNLTFENGTKNNNFRLPLWLLYTFDKSMKLSKKNVKKFCCFVYSNNVKIRNDLCKNISKYKKVDCGGKCLNNIGYRVKNKINFQNQYKFCIASENSLTPGYTTEKILHAFKSNCIPIYYGSNTVIDDFNPETFINANNFKNTDELINYIKEVDNNDKLFNSFMNKPVFSKKWLEIFNDPNETFYKNLANKILK